MEEEKKIGFDTKPPNPKGKKVKFKSVMKKTPLRRWCSLFTILGSITSIISIMYFFLPFFNGILMLILGLILVMLIIVLVVFSLGIALAIDGFRAWVSRSWGVLHWLNDINSNLDKLNPFFMFFATPALLFDFFALLIAIVGQIKEKKGFVTYIVYMAILFITVTLITIFYYMGGFKILH
ncbi:MAG: hypothetical protein K6G28_00400 [Acholeplasmatales bacterium]|nr:hypothetical protein [Acholeplasmatales bacterium]